MGFVTVGSATHSGNRKDKNEDYLSYNVPEDGSMPKKGLLLALADGMGGRAGGAEAARIAVDVLMEEYYKDKSSNIPNSLNSIPHSLIHFFLLPFPFIFCLNTFFSLLVILNPFLYIYYPVFHIFKEFIFMSNNNHYTK